MPGDDIPLNSVGTPISQGVLKCRLWMGKTMKAMIRRRYMPIIEEIVMEQCAIDQTFNVTVYSQPAGQPKAVIGHRYTMPKGRGIPVLNIMIHLVQICFPCQSGKQLNKKLLFRCRKLHLRHPFKICFQYSIFFLPLQLSYPIKNSCKGSSITERICDGRPFILHRNFHACFFNSAIRAGTTSKRSPTMP